MGRARDIRFKIGQSIKRSGFKVTNFIPQSALRYLQDKLIYNPRIEELDIAPGRIPLFRKVFFGELAGFSATAGQGCDNLISYREKSAISVA